MVKVALVFSFPPQALLMDTLLHPPAGTCPLAVFIWDYSAENDPTLLSAVTINTYHLLLGSEPAILLVTEAG